MVTMRQDRVVAPGRDRDQPGGGDGRPRPPRPRHPGRLHRLPEQDLGRERRVPDQGDQHRVETVCDVGVFRDTSRVWCPAQTWRVTWTTPGGC